MIRPTEKQLALLEGFERVAFETCDRVNRTPALKRAAHAFLKTVGAGWVHVCTKNLLHVYGEEKLRALDPDRGVMLVANHRSFFDMYVISCVLLRRTSWPTQMFFPVRADYWYERPDAIVANALMSALAMYPPILRKPEKRAFNEYAVDYLVEAIQTRGTVVGMHPEGTRNKTDDPYTLLPAQPGVGRIVRAANPIVLPVFVLGLGNHLPRQVLGNFDGTGPPITIVFGAPLDLASLVAEPPRLRTYKRIADRLRAELMALGEVERAIRAREGFPISGPKGRAGAV